MSNVILVGYMGSGKSTVGRRLSYRLKKAFLDTDKQIELKEKCTISEIFAKYGEEKFRELETQYLQELLKEKNEYVIATGGGLPMRKENRELLKKLGRVIYLKAEPETVYNRVKNDTTRPLLQTDDPKGRIEEMLRIRHPLYMECADEVIRVDDRQFSEILREIGERGVK